MSSLNKGLGKVEVRLKWDPSPMGEPENDLDIVAAVYRADDPYGAPVYLVHWDSRSPDGTITLNRDSRNGLGFGTDEAMTLEFLRLAPEYGRVVVGVAIQQGEHGKTFGQVPNTHVHIVEGYEELAQDDLSGVPGATAATVAEFARDELGEWRFHNTVQAFAGDPTSFAAFMGQKRT